MKVKVSEKICFYLKNKKKQSYLSQKSSIFAWRNQLFTK